jgi:hypothetical protein
MAKASVKEALALQAGELQREYGDKAKAAAKRAGEKVKLAAGTRGGRAVSAVVVGGLVAAINRKTTIKVSTYELPWGFALGLGAHVVDGMDKGGGDANLRAAADAALAASTALFVDRRAALMGW